MGWYLSIVLAGLSRTVHHVRVLYIGRVEVPASDDHEGFVAGRYRNGVLSNIWTDVRRCAAGTFTAYVPVCECGWLGSDEPVTESGYSACERAWVDEHFGVLPVDGSHAATVAGQLGVPDRDFLRPLRSHRRRRDRRAWSGSSSMAGFDSPVKPRPETAVHPSAGQRTGQCGIADR